MKQRNPHPVMTQLRKIRRAQKLSQGAVAKRIGVETPAICHWETGSKLPLMFNFMCWAEALGVEITVKEITHETVSLDARDGRTAYRVGAHAADDIPGGEADGAEARASQKTIS